MKEIRYTLLTKFQCLGSDCPSSCCDTGWSILYDTPSLSCAQRENQRLDSPIDLSGGIGETETQPEFYPIKLTQKGCFFLKQNGLCRIHEQLGAAVLPSICRTFPREIKQTGKTKELSASLSCPEIARIFLEEENAVSMIEGDIDKNLLVKVDTTRNPLLSRIRNIVLSYMEAHLQRDRNLCYVFKKMILVSQNSLHAYTRNEFVDPKALIQVCSSYPVNKQLSFVHSTISAQAEGTFLLFVMEKVMKGCSLPHSYAFCYEQLNHLLIAAHQPVLGRGACDAEEIFSAYQQRSNLLKKAAGTQIKEWFYRWFAYTVRSHWVVEEESWLVYNCEHILHSFVMNIFLVVHPKAMQGVEHNDIALVKEAMIEILFHSNRIFRHCPKSKEDVLALLKKNPAYASTIIDMQYLLHEEQ